MPRWISLLIAAAICIVIALVLAPYIPTPGDTLVAVIAWIGAAICMIYAIVLLVRTGV